MIRFVLLLIIMVFNISVAAQVTNISDSIRYELYIQNSCKDTTKKIINYSIIGGNLDTVITYYPDENGICHIPVNKNFYYSVIAPLINKPVLEHYIDYAIIDTLNVPPIYKGPKRSKYGMGIGPTYYQWYNCGEQCDGLEQSFRKDGQLWQRGKFKKGKLKYLKTYYSNGYVESLSIDRLLNGCDKKYDETGNIEFKYKYLLFISRLKILDKENDKYLTKYHIGRYK